VVGRRTCHPVPSEQWIIDSDSGKNVEAKRVCQLLR